MLDLYRMFENKLTIINLGEKFENVLWILQFSKQSWIKNNCISYTRYFSNEELKTYENTKSNMSVLNANISTDCTAWTKL